MVSLTLCVCGGGREGFVLQPPGEVGAGGWWEASEGAAAPTGTRSLTHGRIDWINNYSLFTSDHMVSGNRCAVMKSPAPIKRLGTRPDSR